MKLVLRSLIRAALLAVAIVGFTFTVTGPRLSRVVGRPDLTVPVTLSFAEARSLVLENQNGSVRVLPSSDATLTASATIQAFLPDQEIASTIEPLLSNIIRSVADDGHVRLAADLDGVEQYETRILWLLHVPQGLPVTVSTVNGNVRVEQGCGAVDVRGVNADIDITAPTGPCRAETVNGRIRLNGMVGDATAHIRNGNIFADVAAGTLVAETANGYITARAESAQVESLRLKSDNGGVLVKLGPDAPAAIDARATRGVVLCAFECDKTTERRHDRLRGAIGEGTLRVEAQALNGNINIERETP